MIEYINKKVAKGKKWQKSISNWAEIISQFGIIFENRLKPYLR